MQQIISCIRLGWTLPLVTTNNLYYKGSIPIWNLHMWICQQADNQQPRTICVAWIVVAYFSLWACNRNAVSSASQAWDCVATGNVGARSSSKGEWWWLLRLWCWKHNRSGSRWACQGVRCGGWSCWNEAKCMKWGLSVDGLSWYHSKQFMAKQSHSA